MQGPSLYGEDYEDIFLYRQLATSYTTKMRRPLYDDERQYKLVTTNLYGFNNVLKGARNSSHISSPEDLHSIFP